MIRLDRVSARVGRFQLREVSCAVERGAYGVIIGPAGAGKTTLLETIAGIVPVTDGTVTLRGSDVTHAPPETRHIGMVYQHAYLFPHISVLGNVGYGAGDRDSVDEMTERFALGPLLERGVGSLSGGERQLVALARALATRPDILLLDEPFAALDPRTRISVRRQVRSLAAERGMTVLHVTHDFAEAGRLGNVVVLLEGGRVLQSGPPDDVFRRPASPAVADFVGAENVLRGSVRAIGAAAGPERVVEFTSGPLVLHAVSDVPDGPAHAVIRADDISLSLESRTSSVRNQVTGRVIEVVPAGALTRVAVDAGGVELVATITSHSSEGLKLGAGSVVVVGIKATAVHLC